MPGYCDKFVWTN